MLIIIRVCFGWALQRSRDWLADFAPLSQPVRTDRNQNQDLIGSLHCISSVVIGQSNIFGIDFPTLE